MRVGVLNVKANPLMAQSKVVHDMTLMASKCGVCLYQEIQPRRYKDALRALKGLGHAATGSNVPITWRESEFKLIDSGQVKIHGAIPHITPSRYVSWALLEFGKGERTVFMSSHPVNSAWSGRRVPLIPWRKSTWLRHMEIWSDLIADFHDKGLTVIGGADFNRGTVSKLHPNMIWLEDHHKGLSGYDKIFLVPGARGPQFRKAKDNYISEPGEFYTDHRAKVVYLNYS